MTLGTSTVTVDTESEVVLQKGSRGILSCREESNLTINNVAWFKDSVDARPIIQAGYQTDTWETFGEGQYDIYENFSLIIKHVETNDDGLFFCSATILEPITFLISRVNVSVFGKFDWRTAILNTVLQSVIQT